MIDLSYFFLCLFVMAGVTYLIRLLPMLLCKKKIENRFIRSFLYYVPYAVLSVMALPAVLYTTEHVVASALGAGVALLLSFFKKNTIVVCAAAAAVTLAAELLYTYVFI